MSVAKPLPHDAARLHVTGQARYVDDIPLPADTLHLAFGLSGIARGRITGMDLSAVRAAPGVIMVLTADDLPFANDVSPSAHDEPLLAKGAVHYVGQPVFAVVADSHLAARRAAPVTCRRAASWGRDLVTLMASPPAPAHWHRYLPENTASAYCVLSPADRQPRHACRTSA